MLNFVRSWQILLFVVGFCALQVAANPVSLEVVEEFGSDPYGPIVQVGDYMVAAGVRDSRSGREQELSGLLDVLKLSKDKFILVSQFDVKKLFPAQTEVEIFSVAAVKDKVYLLAAGNFARSSYGIITLQLTDDTLKLVGTAPSERRYSSYSKIMPDNNGHLLVTTTNWLNDTIVLQTFQVSANGAPQLTATTTLAEYDTDTYLTSLYRISLHGKSMLLTMHSGDKNKVTERLLYSIALHEDGSVADIVPVRLSDPEAVYQFISHDDRFVYLHSWAKGLEVLQIVGDQLRRIDQHSDVLAPVQFIRRGDLLHIVSAYGTFYSFSQNAQGRLSKAGEVSTLSQPISAFVAGDYLVSNAGLRGVQAIGFEGQKIPAHPDDSAQPKHLLSFSQSSESADLVAIGEQLINASTDGLQVWQVDEDADLWQLRSLNADARQPTYGGHFAVLPEGNRLLSMADNKLWSVDTQNLPLTRNDKLVRRFTLANIDYKLLKLAQGYVVTSSIGMSFFDTTDLLRTKLDRDDIVSKELWMRPFHTTVGEHLLVTMNGSFPAAGKESSSKIKVLHTANLDKITVVAELELKNVYMTSQLLVHGRLMFVPVETYVKAKRSVLVYDIANWSDIKLLSTINVDVGETYLPDSAFAMQWIDGYLVLMEDHAAIFDMSNPQAPKRVRWQSYQSSNGRLVSLGGMLFNIMHGHAGRFQQLNLNFAPVVKPLTLQAKQTQLTKYQLAAFDAEGDPVTYSVVRPASAGYLLIKSGVFIEYKPRAGAAKTDSAVLRATDKFGGFNDFIVTIQISQ